MAELTLEDPERMPNLGSQLRVDLPAEIIYLTAFGGLTYNTPEGFAVFREDRFSSGIDVSLVNPDGCFLAVPKLVRDQVVVGFGTGRLQTVNDAAIRILAHIVLHPKVPVIASL